MDPGLLPALRQAARGLVLRARLPSLLRRRTLPALLAGLDGQARAGRPSARDPARLVERLFRPVRLWPTTCLYRALGGYALLRAAGQRVRFVIGVRTARGRLLAHAWLERSGQPSLDAPPPGAGFTEVYAWPPVPAPDPQPHPRPQGVDRMTGITPSADAVLTELQDGTGVLLDLQTGFYFTLNASGVQAWKLLGPGARDAADLARRLAAGFPQAEPDRVRADVEALLGDLVRESLVTVTT
jgi:hypothetical protein